MNKNNMRIVTENLTVISPKVHLVKIKIITKTVSDHITRKKTISVT